MFCYAGTTAERAQETLDVTLAELLQLAEGVTPEELDAAEGPHQKRPDHAAGIDRGPQLVDRPRLVSTSAECARCRRSRRD